MEPEYFINVRCIKDGVVEKNPFLQLECPNYHVWNNLRVNYCLCNEAHLEFNEKDGLQIAFGIEAFSTEAKDKFALSFNCALSLLMQFIAKISETNVSNDKVFEIAGSILQYGSSEKTDVSSEPLQFVSNTGSLLMSIFTRQYIFTAISDFYRRTRTKP